MHKTIDTILDTRYNIILRIPEVGKYGFLQHILSYFEQEVNNNLICTFSTKERCKEFFKTFQSGKTRIIFIEKQKIALSYPRNLLIFVPERLYAFLTFYPNYNWLSDFNEVIFYDGDLLLNETRSNILEAIIIRFTRFNPFIRKILLSSEIKNIEQLSNWMKAYLLDFCKNKGRSYNSLFFDENNVLTQCLVEIVSSSSRTQNELESFFKSSFAYFQGKKLPSLRNFLAKLLDNNLIMKNGRNYYPTPLGKICAGLQIPLIYQLMFISKLRRGVSPRTLKEEIPKSDVKFYRWMTHAIDSIYKFLREYHERIR